MSQLSQVLAKLLKIAKPPKTYPNAYWKVSPNPVTTVTLGQNWDIFQGMTQVLCVQQANDRKRLKDLSA
jgi:hypothetical protein